MTALTLKIGDGRVGHGKFISALVNCIIVALCLFGLVKVLMRIGMKFRA